MGELVFLEDFDHPYNVFFMLSDGTEGDIWIGSERHLAQIHSGPYNVLLDTKDTIEADLEKLNTPFNLSHSKNMAFKFGSMEGGRRRASRTADLSPQGSGRFHLLVRGLGIVATAGGHMAAIAKGV
jgi:hypothetical protein